MKLEQLMAGMSGDLQPVRGLATRLASDGQNEMAHGIAISPRPLVAPEAHALYIYAPMPPHLIERYEAQFSVSIPPLYRSVLTQISGLRAFEFALFGIPVSMTLDPPRLDRSSVQPYDLATADNQWKREYAVDRSLFHFGGGPLSHEERVGYFLSESGRIHSYRKNGELSHSWDSLSDFLAAELERAEADYPRFEAFMNNLQQSLAQKKRKKRDNTCR
jgi:SMI1 / KNR4 family (SUKH-1)